MSVYFICGLHFEIIEVSTVLLIPHYFLSCLYSLPSASTSLSFSDLLSEAMERVGKEGVITVQDGKTLNNELDVVEGMKFDRGYISPYFITDNKAQIVEFEKPLILLVEKRISNLASLIPLLESVVKSQRPLLIIAEVSNSHHHCYLSSICLLALMHQIIDCST